MFSPKFQFQKRFSSAAGSTRTHAPLKYMPFPAGGGGVATPASCLPWDMRLRAMQTNAVPCRHESHRPSMARDLVKLASLTRRLTLALFSFYRPRFKGPREVLKLVTGCTGFLGHSQTTMAMGRNLRVFHNLGHSSPGRGYSLILEHKALREMLLVEDFAIDNLSKFSFASDIRLINPRRERVSHQADK